MLIGISLQSYGSVCITSWMQGIFSAFTFHFDCMGMPSLLGFLIRAGMACTIVFLIRCWIPDCHCLIQRSIVLTLLLTLHIFHTVPPWCSPRHTVISLAPGPFFPCKVKARRLPKISLALFASQKVWQPSTLFSKSGYSFLFA